MARRRVKLIFPRDAVTQPVIYELGHTCGVITNIRRADITRDEGWVILELEGEEDNLDRAVAYCEEQGVRVTPAEGDVVES
ncbi:MAG: NIL domain-containing protein [Candidatus Dormibacteria bacterium]